ncbi:MAG: hypothetical protein KZQ83_08785 [gamma proteobacterium symbiont of Taylorina sp.]|nr:hypothetical protein [gamma proteobacterium symbiont of Taylorina sp.]
MENQKTSRALKPILNSTDLVLQEHNDISLSESRKAVHISDSVLKQTVTNHSLYVDKSGKASSSPKGLVMQINKRVKKHFSHSVDSMSVDELILLVSLRNAIVKIINTGESNEILRNKIKEQIYSTIEQYGKLIVSLSEVA